MPRIHKLDGLRGLFALFVVLFHFNVNNAPATLVNNFFVRESFIFVDFFFILSGYVITITYNERINSCKSFLQFLKKRFIRLYPMLLFSTGMYWYFVRPFTDKHHIFLALDTLLLTNSTPILGTTIGMNYPSWSISSEMLSYFAFGICSLLAIRKKKDHLIIAITIACFGFLLYQQKYFQTGSWGFIRGLACFNLGYLIHMLATKNIKIHDYLEGVIMIIISAMMYLLYHLKIKNTLIFTFIHFIVPIVFALSIFILIKTNGIVSKLLQTTPLQFLGKISYSLYLNQALVIGFAIPKFYKWIDFLSGETKLTICTLLLFTCLIIYSSGTQLLIESKFGKILSAIITKRENN
jgi:peptidoglycan/LPS O-acetylase OafA/YrhL